MLIIGCSAPTSIYYVNGQLGNDTNPGTLEKPLKTIEQVNSLQLHAGNSVLFAGGQNYSGTLQFKELKGTREQPITIGSYGKGRAIIDGGNGSSIEVSICSSLRIKNLIVTGNGRLKGNTGSGVELRKTMNCSIDSVEANGFLWSGVKAVGGTNLRITNVYAHDNGFFGYQCRI